MHDFIEEHFCKILEEYHGYGMQMTEKVEDCHRFCDLVADYVEKLCKGNGWLWEYSKDQICHHNLLPLISSFMSFTKPDHGKKITERFEGYHDPVVEYLEDLCSRSSGLCVYSK